MAAMTLFIHKRYQVTVDIERRLGFVRVLYCFGKSEKRFAENMIIRKLTTANLRICKRSNAKWRRRWNLK